MLNVNVPAAATLRILGENSNSSFRGYQYDEVEMTLRYRDGADEWTHAFVAARLDEEAVRALLDEAGFGPPVWLDEKRRWGAAAARE